MFALSYYSGYRRVSATALKYVARDGILERHFLAKHSSLSSLLEFMSGFSTPVFTFHKMLFMHRLEFSCFADGFVWIFKTKIEYDFL